jgi:mRNA interferase HigB
MDLPRLPIPGCGAAVTPLSTKPTQIVYALFGATVDFLADNRLIFDIAGNRYRVVVHVSYTYRRVLVKFVGTHAEYDRIQPETA